MSTKGRQAQAPAAGGNKGPTAASTPPPRRGQIKEKIIKDVIAAFSSMAAALVARASKNGGGPIARADMNGAGPVVAGDADGK